MSITALSFAACAAGQRTESPSRARPTDASELLGTPAVLSNIDAATPHSDGTAPPDTSPSHAADAEQATSDASAPQRWSAPPALRAELDRWCASRGRWSIGRVPPSTHGYGVGPGNLSRWQFAERHAPVWTAQPTQAHARDGASTAQENAFANALERALDRRLRSVIPCFRSELDDPARPIVDAGFIEVMMLVQASGAVVGTLHADNATLDGAARCVRMATFVDGIAPTPTPSRPLMFQRVLGVCGSQRAPRREP